MFVRPIAFTLITFHCLVWEIEQSHLVVKMNGYLRVINKKNIVEIG